jgi:hypothetical protein
MELRSLASRWRGVEEEATIVHFISSCSFKLATEYQVQSAIKRGKSVAGNLEYETFEISAKALAKKLQVFSPPCAVVESSPPEPTETTGNMPTDSITT